MITPAKPEHLRKRWMNYFSAPPEGPYPPSRYFNPSASQADRGVPFMISEIGGIGWATEGGWSYGSGPKTLDEFYARYKGTIDAMLDNPNLFGFCYTQLTDIEQETERTILLRSKTEVRREEASCTSRPARPPMNGVNR